MDVSNILSQGLITIIIVVISTVLHELAHGYVAYLLGDTTAKDEGRLSLNPIVHIDLWASIILPISLLLMRAPIFGGAKPVPVDSRNLKGKEYGMALVAVAGPITDLILALLIFVFGYVTGIIYSNNFIQDIWRLGVTINLGFFVFNLIPIPPLDGSRILYAISPDKVREGLMWLEQRTGIILVFSLVFLFNDLLSRFMIGVISGILQCFFWIVGS